MPEIGLTMDAWLLIVGSGLITFFLAWFKLEAKNAAVSYIFSIVFLFVGGITSTNLYRVTESGVKNFHGNAIFGLILIPMSLIAAGLAIDALTEQSINEARV